VERVFLYRCASEGVNPVLLRPTHLDDAAGEMQPGEPLAHEDMAHASYEVTRRPVGFGTSLELDVSTPRTTYGCLCALKPAYQAANIACAVALCENLLGRELDVERLRASVLSCPTPGRFDVLRREPLALIDACHNPQSVETFLVAVRAMEPEVAKRPALLAAVLADKDVAGIVALLAKEFPCVHVTQTSSPRALEAGELGRLFETEGAEVAGVYPTVDEAVAALSEVPYVACGSITLAGEVAALM
jgi:dihydrofolate synthase/folylpolyglutamate synthase